MKRAFILLLDSFGLGATPDAAKYNDVGANTFGHIASWAAKSGTPMSLPTMEQLGLAAAAHTASGEWAEGFALRDGFTAAYGAARERSTGKDTQSGHWEIAGVPVDFDWGYFPKTVAVLPARADRQAAGTDRRAGLPRRLPRLRHRHHQQARRRACRIGQADYLHLRRLGDADRRARRIVRP